MKLIKKMLIILFIFGIQSIYSELTDQQRWAIALTGIMTESNKDSFDTLNSDLLNEENRNKYTAMLKRDWGIENREDLLSTMEKMESNGHATELVFCQKIIKECESEQLNYNIFSIINKYNISSKQYNYLKFVIANWSLFHNRNILVWDLGRNIALCRWGYDCGYLSEDEAWQKIMYYAKKIQPMYTQWKDFGFDYYMGRVFWASGFGSDVDYLYKTNPIYQKLISDSGYWNKMEWNIVLE